MTALIIDPSAVAAEFRKALRDEIAALPTPLRLLGHMPSTPGAAVRRSAFRSS
jgi:hypothetical protein